VCNQVRYGLEERAIEHRDLAVCERQRIAIVAYSPFGRSGFPSARTPGGRVLAEIAQAHGATPRQVALRFLARRPSVFVIAKALSIAHVEDNAAADALALSPAEIRRIESAFPLGAPRTRRPKR
jgi:diketogulonate reductase-like aldo/keto reductase